MKVVHKTLFISALDFQVAKEYTPTELRKGGKENMNNELFVFEPEQHQFPNLLADKDFRYYNWTLPFCNF